MAQDEAHKAELAHLNWQLQQERGCCRKPKSVLKRAANAPNEAHVGLVEINLDQMSQQTIEIVRVSTVAPTEAAAREYSVRASGILLKGAESTQKREQSKTGVEGRSPKRHSVFRNQNGVNFVNI